MKKNMIKSNHLRMMMKILLKNVKNFYSIIIQHQSIPPAKFNRHECCYKKCVNLVFRILSVHSSMHIRNFCKMPNCYQALHYINCFRVQPAFVIMTMGSELRNIFLTFRFFFLYVFIKNISFSQKSHS